jgi:hypothetical protein
MTLVTMNLDYVVEGVDLVTFSGTDRTTGARVAVAIDLKPHARLIEALQSADEGNAVAYRANGLTVLLDVDVAVAACAEARR